MADDRADAHVLHHREGDHHGSDFRGKRYAEEREVIIQRAEDRAHWKIVGAVASLLATLIISLLTYLAVRDRQSIDQTLVHHDARLSMQEQTAARHDADLSVLKNSGERQAEDIAEMKATIRRMDEKLDRVLAEVRKKN